MSSAGGSMQRRRYTVTSAAQQKNEYPEHLNPFHEENEDGKTNNRFSSLGRRNSRLTASLRIKSWFPSKSSKSDIETDNTDSPTKSKDRFLTLTPKISRQIKDVFTHKRSKNKSDNLPPIPQYVPARKPLPDQFVGGEFTLSPRASRERFAMPSATSAASSATSATPSATSATPSATSTTPGEADGRRSASPAEPLQGVQPPKPLPRTILPKVTTRVGEDVAEIPPPKPPRVLNVDAKEASTSAENIAPANTSLKITEEDNKYVRQGARPKKKRQAPLPPTNPSLPPSSKEINEPGLSEETSQSASISSDCPSPSPEQLLASTSQPHAEAESPPPSSTSPTEVKEEDRLI